MSRFRKLCVIVACLLALVAAGFLYSARHNDAGTPVATCPGTCWGAKFGQLPVNPDSSASWRH